MYPTGLVSRGVVYSLVLVSFLVYYSVSSSMKIVSVKKKNMVAYHLRMFYKASRDTNLKSNCNRNIPKTFSSHSEASSIRETSVKRPIRALYPTSGMSALRADCLTFEF